MKVGDKVYLEGGYEWEVHEIKQDTVILRALWKGKSVADNEIVWAIREEPKCKIERVLNKGGAI